MTDWSRLVRPSLHGLHAYDPGPSVAELEAQSGHAIVRLNRNEDLFPPLAGVRDAVADELSNIWMYPEESYAEFRAAAAAWLGTTPDRIVPAHGTQALIGTLAGLLLDPGDAVVVPQPTYGLYSQVSAARGADVHRVPLRELRREDRLDLRSEQPHGLARGGGRVARVPRRAARRMCRRRRRGVRRLRRPETQDRACARRRGGPPRRRAPYVVEALRHRGPTARLRRRRPSARALSRRHAGAVQRQPWRTRCGPRLSRTAGARRGAAAGGRRSTGRPVRAATCGGSRAASVADELRARAHGRRRRCARGGDRPRRPARPRGRRVRTRRLRPRHGRAVAADRPPARARLRDPADAVPGARLRRSPPLLGRTRAVRHAALPPALPAPREARRGRDRAARVGGRRHRPDRRRLESDHGRRLHPVGAALVGQAGCDGGRLDARARRRHLHRGAEGRAGGTRTAGAALDRDQALVRRLRPGRGAAPPRGAARMTDPRARRIAVVADSLFERLLDELEREGFGIIQLPPAGLDRETVVAWLEQTAEHVAEFRRNDYEIVLADDGLFTAELDEALAAVGVPPLGQYAIQPPSTSRLTPET